MLRRAGLAILAALLLAAPARAGTWEVPRVPLGVALAGDRVVWLEPHAHARRADLYVARAGHESRRVQVLPAGDALGLAASGSTVAVLLRGPGGVQVMAGRAGSPLEPIATCAAALADPSVDVSDRLVAFTGCGAGVVVRDLDGARPDAVPGSHARSVQIAGRYVAWVRRGGRRVVVHDLRHGGTSYEVGAAGVRSLALQDNGKVAFGLDANETGSEGLEVLGWATRRKPTVHALHMANRFSYYPRMAGGQVVFGRAAVKATESEGREVGITDLWSGHVLILSRHLTDVTSVDFDGETIAYAERRRGDGARIRTQAAPEPEPPPSEPAR
ncbi:MAG TPA: hypothetical protein VJT75_19915 [Thermoleophilaceae bacterium]|nr:hypothetical protein [Thermoleophilaceae bacterium]